MEFVRTGNRYILKLERGSEVIETLTQFAKQEHIGFATIAALGAVDEISCGYYSLSKRVYRFTSYEGAYEVLNATGNITIKEGVPFVHLHATFSDVANAVFGGHVEQMRVGLVLEVVLVVSELNVVRQPDDETGLQLMQL